jgi:uncharacterized membrane protein YeiH
MGLMKTIIIILFIFLSFTSVCQTTDKWTTDDKKVHCTVSFMITTTAIEALRNYTQMKYIYCDVIGVSVGLAVGLSKELFYDDRFSYQDMTANTLGCATGLILSKILNKRVNTIYKKRGWT